MVQKKEIGGMKKIKCVAYCRVSTGKVEQATSLVNQTQYFKTKCSEHENYELGEIYADRGVSGKKLKRPEYNRMLEDAGLDLQIMSNGEIHLSVSDREPKFELILIKDTSRLARNILIYDAIEKLRKKDVYIEFTDINKSTRDRTNDPILQIIMTLDAEESQAKSRKVAFGHRQSMLQEIPVIPTASYGYEKIDKKHLKIIKEQAEVVKFVYDLYVNGGRGIRGIVEECHKYGYKSKRGKDLGKSTITLMLKNPIYKGTLERGKRDFGTLNQDKIDMLKMKPEEEWVIHHNHQGIPVIIDEETWQKAQDIMNGRLGNTGLRGKRKSKSKYSGLLKCGVCGQNYRANSDRGRKLYTCGNKRDNGIKACNSKNINESQIDIEIEEYAKTNYYMMVTLNIFMSKMKLEKIKQQAIQVMSSDKDVIQISEKKDRINAIVGMKTKMLNLHIEGLYTLEEMKSKVSALNAELEQLELELDFLDKNVDIFKSEINEIDETLNRLDKIEVKKEYEIQEIFDEIEYIKIIGEHRTGIELRHYKKEHEIKGEKYKAVHIEPVFKVDLLIERLLEKYKEDEK